MPDLNSKASARSITSVKVNFVFLLALVASVLAALYSFLILIRGITLTSDVLYMDRLFQSLSRGGDLTLWSQMTAPAYFPDMILYFISATFGDNAYDRIAWTTLGQGVLLWHSIYFCLSKLNEFRARTVMLVATLAVAFIYAASAEGDANVWFFFPSTNNHFSIVYLGLVSLGVFLSRMTKLKFLLILVVTITGALSSSLYLIAVVIPLMLLSVYRGLKPKESFGISEMIGWLVSLGLGVIGYLVLKPMLIAIDQTQERLHFGLSAVKLASESIRSAAVNFLTQPHFFTNASLILILVTMLWLGILFFFYPNKQSNNFWLLVLFSIFSIVITVTVGAISGGIADVYLGRYFALPSIIICAISIAYLFQVLWKRQTNINVIVVSALVTLALFVQNQQAPRAQTNQASEIISCLQDLGKTAQIGSGVSDYWDAGSTAYGLRYKQRVLATLQNGQPFVWMSNTADYDASLIDKFGPINFAIVHGDSNPGVFDFARARLRETFPVPSRIHQCGGTDRQIWMYEGLELDSFISSKANEILGKLKK
jgi:hypothetical protein